MHVENNHRNAVAADPDVNKPSVKRTYILAVHTECFLGDLLLWNLSRCDFLIGELAIGKSFTSDHSHATRLLTRKNRSQTTGETARDRKFCDPIYGEACHLSHHAEKARLTT